MPIYAAWPLADRPRERKPMSRNAMQRLSFYLLVLLALYASLAGAA
ncbi:hypothetical protein [Paracoccus siganidrum]|nr:hypothetical protein [Paracoccus siganidrum]